MERRDPCFLLGLRRVLFFFGVVAVVVVVVVVVVVAHCYSGLA